MVEYTVVSNLGKKFIINFNNCKEADNLLATLRSERLPALESNI